MDKVYPAVSMINTVEKSQWYLINDKQYLYPVIRRSVRANGKVKWERFPAKEYKHMTRAEVESLLRKLNASYESEKNLAEARYDFNHAYISKDVKQKYRDYLESQANSVRHINSQLSNLDRHTLQFFVLQKKVADPSMWKKLEAEWGKWLVHEQKLSYNSVMQVIYNANRFLVFLKERAFPGKINPQPLEPMSRNKLKLLKLNSSNERYKFIPEEKFAKIELDFRTRCPHLLPYLNLCYHFGARIAESLGFQPCDVFEDSLAFERQASAYRRHKIITKPLKNLDNRTVPYWFAKPQDAYEWISAIKGQSPTTLNKRINKALLKHGHESHDLRRSFVTRALRVQHWRDVMRAAGHKDMETTLRYDQPLTQSEKKLFKPTL